MATAARGASPEETLLAVNSVISLMKAADVARRAMSRTLRQSRLTLPQFNVLVILRDLGELPTLDVAARLVEEAPGITRLMATLAAKRYIRRRRNTSDARQQLCSLTPSGRRLIEAVLPRIHATQRALIQDLNRDEARQLVALNRRIHNPRESAADTDNPPTTRPRI